MSGVICGAQCGYGERCTEYAGHAGPHYDGWVAERDDVMAALGAERPEGRTWTFHDLLYFAKRVRERAESREPHLSSRELDVFVRIRHLVAREGWKLCVDPSMEPKAMRWRPDGPLPGEAYEHAVPDREPEVTMSPAAFERMLLSVLPSQPAHQLCVLCHKAVGSWYPLEAVGTDSGLVICQNCLSLKRTAGAAGDQR